MSDSMAGTTEQEAFWQGQFGDDYAERNQGRRWVAANTALFSEILARTSNVRSVLELGSNIGLNLMALRLLLPEAGLSAVEINEKAALELQRHLPEVDLHRTSAFAFEPSRTWDLVFTKGFLIHIAPDRLAQIYRLMVRSAARYLLVCEYYNPSPMEVEYRGHQGKLFKRDFAGEILDAYSDLTLVDYGFVYHRDPNFPQDDMTWFLMEKGGATS